jgi:two-component system CheB/CheR fusion protein
MVCIEIWDTGIGIADEELLAIFDEYHQIDNAARERSRGLGLGLSIVRRLVELLDHRITVHSRPGKGSVFAVEIKVASETALPALESRQAGGGDESHGPEHAGTILVVEDDPDLRELLESFFGDEGYSTVSAHDGPTALALMTREGIRPSLLLADFNLPNGVTGLELAAQVQSRLNRKIPVIILTGDISNATAHHIEAQKFQGLNKPVKLNELTATVRRLLRDAPKPIEPLPTAATPAAKDDTTPMIFVVDDDPDVRNGIRVLLEEEGHLVEDFDSCEAFLAAFHAGRKGCLLLDAYLPGMTGLELLRRLKEMGHHMPTIMITGKSDVPTAVQAMKSGAADFLEKPLDRIELFASIERALEQSRDDAKRAAWHDDAASRIASLTRRQQQIMGLILASQPNKNIAADLGISQRTVEHHRASIMEKTGSKSLLALARLALAAETAKS